MEEFRAYVERFVITLINLRIISKDDFDEQLSGAVMLNSDGRKKVITEWQSKKKEIIMHPYIKEKIPRGLFPYVQANIMAKYIRGDIPEYVSLEIQ